MTNNLSRKERELLEQALAKLLSNLELSFSLEPELKDIDTRRERYAAALTSFAQFCRSFQTSFADHFFELGSALRDLNNGTVAPLLRPTRNGKRGSDPSSTWRQRAHAVLGLEGLMIAKNFNEADALKLVEHLYKPETLRTWRKEISANRNERLVDRLFEAKTVLDLGRQELAKIRDNGDALRAFIIGQFYRAEDYH